MRTAAAQSSSEPNEDPREVSDPPAPLPKTKSQTKGAVMGDGGGGSLGGLGGGGSLGGLGGGEGGAGGQPPKRHERYEVVNVTLFMPNSA